MNLHVPQCDLEDKHNNRNMKKNLNEGMEMQRVNKIHHVDKHRTLIAITAAILVLEVEMILLQSTVASQPFFSGVVAIREI